MRHNENEHPGLSINWEDILNTASCDQLSTSADPISDDEMVFHCQHCDFSGSVDGCRQHVVIHFNGERTFTWQNCGYCNFQALSGAAVTRHCRNVHKEQAPCHERRTVTLIGTMEPEQSQDEPVDNADVPDAGSHSLSYPLDDTLPGIDRYHCDHCSASFDSETDFKDHVCPVDS